MTTRQLFIAMIAISACLTLVFALFGPNFPRALFDRVDIDVYYTRSSDLISGYFGLGDVRSEYPILAVLFFVLPRLLTPNPEIYQHLYPVMSGLASLALLVTTGAILRYLGRSMTWLALLFLPATVYFTYSRFDVFPAFWVSLAVFLFLRGRQSMSFLALVAGFLTKGYAIFLIPVFLFFLPSSLRRLRLAIIVGLVVILALATLLSMLTGNRPLEPFATHFFRGVTVGTLPTFLTFGGSLPQIIDWLPTALTVILTWAALAITTRRTPRPTAFLTATAATVAAVVFAAPILSPQWIIWLLPLVLLLPLTRVGLALLVAVDTTTYLFFPFAYDTLGLTWHASTPAYYAFTGARLLALLALLVWIVAVVPRRPAIV